MTAFEFCGFKQFACLSARATGRRGENNLIWIIGIFGLAIIAISAYFINKIYFSTPKNQIEKSDSTFSVVR
jgi:hypothetical protein